MKKRIFIAIDISDEIRAAAALYIKQMSEQFPHAPIKWERPEKLHLTIKFLGGTEETVIPDVIDLVSQSAKATRPFVIDIGGTGAFPSVRNPRILWLGVSESTGVLKDLAVSIDNGCTELGFEPETRAFKPHLSLARIRDPRHAGEIGTRHAANEFGPFRFTCNEIVIYESHLGRVESTYERLHTAKLGG